MSHSPFAQARYNLGNMVLELIADGGDPIPLHTAAGRFALGLLRPFLQIPKEAGDREGRLECCAEILELIFEVDKSIGETSAECLEDQAGANCSRLFAGLKQLGVEREKLIRFVDVLPDGLALPKRNWVLAQSVKLQEAAAQGIAFDLSEEFVLSAETNGIIVRASFSMPQGSPTVFYERRRDTSGVERLCVVLHIAKGPEPAYLKLLGRIDHPEYDREYLAALQYRLSPGTFADPWERVYSLLVAQFISDPTDPISQDLFSILRPAIPREVGREIVKILAAGFCIATEATKRLVKSLLCGCSAEELEMKDLRASDLSAVSRFCLTVAGTETMCGEPIRDLHSLVIKFLMSVPGARAIPARQTHSTIGELGYKLSLVGQEWLLKGETSDGCVIIRLAWSASSEKGLSLVSADTYDGVSINDSVIVPARSSFQLIPSIHAEIVLKVARLCGDDDLAERAMRAMLKNDEDSVISAIEACHERAARVGDPELRAKIILLLHRPELGLTIIPAPGHENLSVPIKPGFLDEHFEHYSFDGFGPNKNLCRVLPSTHPALLIDGDSPRLLKGSQALLQKHSPSVLQSLVRERYQALIEGLDDFLLGLSNDNRFIVGLANACPQNPELLSVLAAQDFKKRLNVIVDPWEAQRTVTEEDWLGKVDFICERLENSGFSIDEFTPESPLILDAMGSVLTRLGGTFRVTVHSHSLTADAQQLSELPCAPEKVTALAQSWLRRELLSSYSGQPSEMQAGEEVSMLLDLAVSMQDRGVDIGPWLSRKGLQNRVNASLGKDKHEELLEPLASNINPELSRLEIYQEAKLRANQVRFEYIGSRGVLTVERYAQKIDGACLHVQLGRSVILESIYALEGALTSSIANEQIRGLINDYRSVPREDNDRIVLGRLALILAEIARDKNESQTEAARTLQNEGIQLGLEVMFYGDTLNSELYEDRCPSLSLMWHFDPAPRGSIIGVNEPLIITGQAGPGRNIAGQAELVISAGMPAFLEEIKSCGLEPFVPNAIEALLRHELKNNRDSEGTRRGQLDVVTAALQDLVGGRVLTALDQPISELMLNVDEPLLCQLRALNRLCDRLGWPTPPVPPLQSFKEQDLEPDITIACMELFPAGDARDGRTLGLCYLVDPEQEDSPYRVKITRGRFECSGIDFAASAPESIEVSEDLEACLTCLSCPVVEEASSCARNKFTEEFKRSRNFSPSSDRALWLGEQAQRLGLELFPDAKLRHRIKYEGVELVANYLEGSPKILDDIVIEARLPNLSRVQDVVLEGALLIDPKDGQILSKIPAQGHESPRLMFDLEDAPPSLWALAALLPSSPSSLAKLMLVNSERTTEPLLSALALAGGMARARVDLDLWYETGGDLQAFSERIQLEGARGVDVKVWPMFEKVFQAFLRWIGRRFNVEINMFEASELPARQSLHLFPADQIVKVGTLSGLNDIRIVSPHWVSLTEPEMMSTIEAISLKPQTEGVI